MATRIDFIDIYSFYDEIDSYIIESLMDGSRISCCIKSLANIPLKPTVGDFSEKRVSVEADKAEEACTLLAEAVRSGIISREGKFRV